MPIHFYMVMPTGLNIGIKLLAFAVAVLPSRQVWADCSRAQYAQIFRDTLASLETQPPTRLRSIVSPGELSMNGITGDPFRVTRSAAPIVRPLGFGIRPDGSLLFPDAHWMNPELQHRYGLQVFESIADSGIENQSAISPHFLAGEFPWSRNLSSRAHDYTAHLLGNIAVLGGGNLEPFRRFAGVIHALGNSPEFRALPLSSEVLTYLQAGFNGHHEAYSFAWSKAVRDGGPNAIAETTAARRIYEGFGPEGQTHAGPFGMRPRNREYTIFSDPRALLEHFFNETLQRCRYIQNSSARRRYSRVFARALTTSSDDLRPMPFEQFQENLRRNSAMMQRP